MTDKRFVSYFDKEHNYIIQDLIDGDEYQVGFANCDEDEFLEKVNELNQSYSTLKHRHSLLHDELLDVECERDSLKKDVNSLEKENKELKKRIEWFKEVIRKNGFKVKE